MGTTATNPLCHFRVIGSYQAVPTTAKSPRTSGGRFRSRTPSSVSCAWPRNRSRNLLAVGERGFPRPRIIPRGRVSGFSSSGKLTRVPTAVSRMTVGSGSNAMPASISTARLIVSILSSLPILLHQDCRFIISKYCHVQYISRYYF